MLRAAAVYLAISWAAIEIGATVFPALLLPDWSVRLVIVLVAIGFPLLLVGAWIFDWTDQGAKRDAGHPAAEADASRPGRPADAPSAPGSRSRRRGIYVGAAGAIALTLAVLLFARRDATAPDVPPQNAASDAIAILPFEVSGRGQELWREGMVDLLATNLDGVAGVRAIDSRTILARWRDATSRAPSIDTRGALDLAAGTGARFALLGSLVAAGATTRIAFRVYTLDEPDPILSTHVDGPTDSVFSLVDQLSIEVLGALLRDRTDVPSIRLSRVMTSSLPSLTAFVEAEALLRRGSYEAASDAYRRALERDSTFALAWFGLALSEGWAGTLESAAHASRRAVRYIAALPERDALLVRGWYENEAASAHGLELIRVATRRYPDDALAWYLLGETIFHYGDVLLQDPEEGLRAFEHAIELDPEFLPARIHPVHIAMRTSLDADRVAPLIDEYERLAPGSPEGMEMRLAYGLVHGGDAVRDSLLAWLPHGATDLYLPFFAHQSLSHPALLDLKAEVLEIARDRQRPNEARSAARLLVQTLLASARIGDALEALEHPLMAGSGYESLYVARLAGLEIDDRLIDARVAAAEDNPLTRHFIAGARALERDDRVRYAAALSGLREVTAASRATADSAAAGLATGALLALDGYRAVRAGQLERGLELLENARIGTASDAGSDINAPVRWWLADAALRTGNEERAARLYASLSHGAAFAGDPFAMLQLGRVNERLGRGSEALRDYTLCTQAWRHADVTGGVVAEAQRGVARLRTDRGLEPRD